MLSSVILVDLYAIIFETVSSDGLKYNVSYISASVLVNWPPAATTFYVFRQLDKILSKSPEVNVNKRQIRFNQLISFLLLLSPLLDYFLPKDLSSDNAFVLFTVIDGIKGLIFISIDIAILVFCWRVTTHKPEDGKTNETEEPIVEEEDDEIAQISLIVEQLDEEEAPIISNGDLRRQNIAEKLVKFLLNKYQNEPAETQELQVPMLGAPQEDIRVTTTSI